jgi:superfamily II DNA helicase RecQ
LLAAAENPEPPQHLLLQQHQPRASFSGTLQNLSGDFSNYLQQHSWTVAEEAFLRVVYGVAYKEGQYAYSFQEESLLSFVRLHHTLVIAPTNAGKSRIFLLMILWLLQSDPHAMLVIVYPLIGLEKMQVDVLNKAHTLLNATFYDRDGDTAKQKRSIRDGKHRVIGVSPEVVTTKWFKKVARSSYFSRHLRAICIDEFHTVVTWGRTFRGAYAQLRELIVGRVQLMMVTCTLTTQVEREALRDMGLTKSNVNCVRRSIIKRNLFIEIRKRPGDQNTVRRHSLYHLAPLVELLRAHSKGTKAMDRVLWLCGSGNSVNKHYAYILRELGADAYVPHTSEDYRDCLVQRTYSSHDERNKNFIKEKFITNPASKGRLLISTSLSEMGLDFSGLTNLVISQCPRSKLQFRQQVGRVGRGPDEKSQCIVLVNGADYAGADDDMVVLSKDKERCTQKELYTAFKEKFECTSDELWCANCCSRNNAPKPTMFFAESPLPPLPVVPSPPTTAAVDHVRTCLLRSLGRAGPAIPALRSLSPLLTGTALDERVALREGGRHQLLCKEYATAFGEGLDMTVYSYADTAHKPIVLASIAAAPAVAPPPHSAMADESDEV